MHTNKKKWHVIFNVYRVRFVSFFPLHGSTENQTGVESAGEFTGSTPGNL